MYTTRREFIKSLGISIASVVLNRCAPLQESSIVHEKKTSSYLSSDPSTEAMEYASFDDPALAANIRIRQCWEHLDWLVRHLYDPHWTGGDPRPILIKCHFTALNDMVAMGELSREGAQEIHTAFGAAIDHILRTTLSMAC